ncbi:MAG: hypothetical protein EOP49_10830 [Sphingobacteriales bacterium]|nr:MAG: hypothetical protein EOP49_10830 [Sphingobacteriales bacterium]
MNANKATTIDEYIAGFPPDVQVLLEEVRQAISQVAPDATETISYAIPTFRLHGNLVHFAAFKNHIGLYPAPRALEAFAAELAEYKGSKGTVQFPLDQPLPIDLIQRIVKYRIEETAASKTRKKA